VAPCEGGLLALCGAEAPVKHNFPNVDYHFVSLLVWFSFDMFLVYATVIYSFS
jgi:hypothetical protein